MDIAKLKQDLDAAVEAHADAVTAESIARNRETDARNRLNNAQKAFDAAVDEIRKAAPRLSDWGSRGRPS